MFNVVVSPSTVRLPVIDALPVIAASLTVMLSVEMSDTLPVLP